MLSKLRKKFHAVKYVYSIQIDRLEPWPCDDLPVCILWKRGSKKSKKGQTEHRIASELGEHQTSTSLLVQQSFDLSATLYSDKSKTKHTGPYQRKDCHFTVVQMTSDGTLVQALLGKAILNLAEISGCHEETIVEIPLNCDADLRSAVGQPKLILKCRVGRGNNTTSFVPFPKTIQVIPSGKNGVAMAGTHSDLSSMSNDATKGKKLGVLTLEQEVSLEGFEGRPPQLGSIQEVVSPTVSVEEEDSSVAQGLEGSEKNSCPGEQHVLVVAGASLSAIAEETTVTDEVSKRVNSEEIEDSAHSEDHEENCCSESKPPVTGAANKACPDSAGHVDESKENQTIEEPKKRLKTETATDSSYKPELNVFPVAEIASIMDSYWLTGRLNHHSIARPAAKGESTNWWSMVISLLTCMPARPQGY